ncbi:MAG: hypothetical protein GX660_29065 [Clostridiaceae bacterium]|nr:hypothetical protein [Clostridiaceae bacterium]
MNDEPNLICYKCNLKLEPRKTVLKYLGFSLNADLLRCPLCGLVYLPEELVKGKMAEVEMLLEDK